MTGVRIRALEQTDWAAFRDFRLDALKAAPGVFAIAYDQAAHLPAQEWQTLAKGEDHQVFGLFDAKDLIGITAVFTDRQDPTGRTAFLAMSFISPRYHGRGLSRMLYDARLAWILGNRSFAASWSLTESQMKFVDALTSATALSRRKQFHGLGSTVKPRTKYSMN